MSRRDEILDVLVEQFKIKGFNSDFTMSELADCVNIGKSTIYEYFGNKDDIIKAAVIKYMQISIDSVDLGEELNQLSFENVFKKQLSVILKIANQSRTLLEALSPGFIQKLPDSMRDEMKAKMESTRNKLQKRFQSFFLKGIEEGIINPNVDPSKGSIVTSLVVGTIITFSSSNTTTSLEDVVNNVYDSVVTLLQ